MIHVSSGSGRFGPLGQEQEAGQEQAVFFERPTSGPNSRLPSSSPAASGADDAASVSSGEQASVIEFSCPAGADRPLDVMLLAGLPTDEPIVQ